MQPHFFVSSSDGALYDTRVANWHAGKPLRATYSRGFPEIRTTAEFKAALRNGQFAWPGGYQCYLICSDGAPLCFECGHKEARNILPAIADKDGSGWRVVATDINYEDTDLHCENCSKQIPAAYSE